MTAPLQHLRALLFDAGDVIYHRPRRGQAIKAFLATHGLALAGRDITQRNLSFRGALSQTDCFRDRLRRSGLTDAAALDEGVAIMVRAQSDIELFDGVPATLMALKRAGLKLGIVTNTNDPTLRKLGWFKPHGIDLLWDSFATSCELNSIKPEAEIYRAALLPLDLPASQVGFVGHSGAELAGAKALGLATISFNRDSDAVRGDAHAARFADLLALTGHAE